MPRNAHVKSYGQGGKTRGRHKGSRARENRNAWHRVKRMARLLNA